MGKKIFLAHSRPDKGWIVGLIHHFLGAGHDVFIDSLPETSKNPVGGRLFQLNGGEDWEQSLEHARNWAEIIILVFSQDAFERFKKGEGKGFALEIAFAFASEERKVIPILIDKDHNPTDTQANKFESEYEQDLLGRLDYWSLEKLLQMLDEEELGGQTASSIVEKLKLTQFYRIGGLKQDSASISGDRGNLNRLSNNWLISKNSKFDYEEFVFRLNWIDRTTAEQLMRSLFLPNSVKHKEVALLHGSTKCEWSNFKHRIQTDGQTDVALAEIIVKSEREAISSIEARTILEIESQAELLSIGRNTLFCIECRVPLKKLRWRNSRGLHKREKDLLRWLRSFAQSQPRSAQFCIVIIDANYPVTSLSCRMSRQVKRCIELEPIGAEDIYEWARDHLGNYFKELRPQFDQHLAEIQLELDQTDGQTWSMHEVRNRLIQCYGDVTGDLNASPLT